MPQLRQFGRDCGESIHHNVTSLRDTVPEGVRRWVAREAQSWRGTGSVLLLAGVLVMAPNDTAPATSDAASMEPAAGHGVRVTALAPGEPCPVAGVALPPQTPEVSVGPGIKIQPTEAYNVLSGGRAICGLTVAGSLVDTPVNVIVQEASGIDPADARIPETVTALIPTN